MTSRRRLVTRWTTVLCAATVCLAGASGYTAPWAPKGDGATTQPGGASDGPRPGFDHWVSFRGQGPYTNPTLNINGARTETPGYTTDLLTDHAVEFIGRDHDRPFLLYLSHKAVHAPFTPAGGHDRPCRPQRFGQEQRRRCHERGWAPVQRSASAALASRRRV